jgi:hypothetical protein
MVNVSADTTATTTWTFDMLKGLAYDGPSFQGDGIDEQDAPALSVFHRPDAELWTPLDTAATIYRPSDDTMVEAL